MSTGLLPFDPEAVPLLPLGPTPKQVQASQKEQTRRVLAMLQAGPCTTGDFLQARIGRFGARLLELRAVGHRIEMQKTGEHGAVYRLL